MTWSPSAALRQIRLSLSINQRAFAERLTISPTHISLIEAGKKTPSEMLLKLASYEFDVNLNWLETGAGEPFQDIEENRDFEKSRAREEMKKRVMITSAILVPLLPAAAAGLAISVGAEEILDKMKRAYGAKTMSELATKFLKTDVSALSRWKTKGKIPEKYLEMLPETTGKPIEYFLLNENYIEEGRQEIISFIQEIVKADRKSHLDMDEIALRFNNKFPLQKH